jgi:hypothetical protein
MPEPSEDDDVQAQAWLAGIDPAAYVGARHHTVPRFLLARWADQAGQVRVFHRVEGRHGIENVRDLAVRDFYTVIDKAGMKNSSVESLLGHIEGRAKRHIDAILSPFARPAPLGADAVVDLAQFAAFQSTRTARHRREIELHAEWFAKTMVSGRVPDEELRAITVAPHQNEGIQFSAHAARSLMPYFACRPLAVVHLGAPLLYSCDEPVVLNAPAGELHTEDCYLSDEDVEARNRRRARKARKTKGKRARLPGRIIHFSSTRPTGHGVADEIVLAISPGTALLWGPLADEPREFVERIHLTTSEATRFARMANDAMCSQALDWIITRLSDARFVTRAFPPLGPLMQVCDGTNAASSAVNETPTRLRPLRLWMPDD